MLEQDPLSGITFILLHGNHRFRGRLRRIALLVRTPAIAANPLLPYLQQRFCCLLQDLPWAHRCRELRKRT